MTEVEITANEMADEFGINQKSFRRALRTKEICRGMSAMSVGRFGVAARNTKT